MYIKVLLLVCWDETWVIWGHSTKYWLSGISLETNLLFLRQILTSKDKSESLCLHSNFEIYALVFIGHIFAWAESYHSKRTKKIINIPSLIIWSNFYMTYIKSWLKFYKIYYKPVLLMIRKENVNNANIRLRGSP